MKNIRKNAIFILIIIIAITSLVIICKQSINNTKANLKNKDATTIVQSTTQTKTTQTEITTHIISPTSKSAQSTNKNNPAKTQPFSDNYDNFSDGEYSKRY